MDIVAVPLFTALTKAFPGAQPLLTGVSRASLPSPRPARAQQGAEIWCGLWAGMRPQLPRWSPLTSVRRSQLMSNYQHWVEEQKKREAAKAAEEGGGEAPAANAAADQQAEPPAEGAAEGGGAAAAEAPADGAAGGGGAGAAPVEARGGDGAAEGGDGGAAEE